MKNILLILAFSILTVGIIEAQVVVENRQQLSHSLEKGFFIENHPASIILSEVPAGQKIYELIKEDSLDIGSKTYRFATPIKIDIDFLQSASWITRGSMSYGRLLIVAENAKSLSLNFDGFSIPDLTELVIYNSAGTIAGPVTSKENNDGQTWQAQFSVVIQFG